MNKRHITIATILALSILTVLAGSVMSVPQDVRTGRQPKKDTVNVKAQPVLDDEDAIPDSLLNPRWKIQRTTPSPTKTSTKALPT